MVHWENQLVSGNVAHCLLPVQDTPREWCNGEAPVWANTPDMARSLYARAFPRDIILLVS